MQVRKKSEEDLKSENSFENEKVKPEVTNQSTLDDGTLTSMLHKASWNVIRLAR